MKNKKGTLEYVLILILFVALVFTTLFYSSLRQTKIETKIINGKFVEGVYAKEEFLKYYLNKAGEKAISDSQGSGEALKINFLYNFKRIFLEYKFNDDYLIEFQRKIKNNEFEIRNFGGRIVLEVPFELRDSYNGFDIIYKLLIEQEFYPKQSQIHGNI